jgi:uroporphyrinogen decarboxylase
MDHLERIRAATLRQPVDRVPFALWRHFPAEDQDPRGLAQATLLFQRRYPSDFVKVTFTGGYAVEDWGCEESAHVEPDGHRPCARHAVLSAGDWEKIEPLDPRAGAYGRSLETVSLIVKEVGGAPVVPTIFSPLSLARKLSGDRLNADLKDHAERVGAALSAITDTQIRFAAACLEAGAAGVFYSIQDASLRFHSEAEYALHGEPHDRRFLESLLESLLDSLRDRKPFTILHAHGSDLFFGRLAALPADIVNWEDRSTPPSLKEGRARVKGAVLGGLSQWKTLREGTPREVKAEIRDAISQTGGLGLIVGPGCVIPLDAPPENLQAVVEACGSPT